MPKWQAFVRASEQEQLEQTLHKWEQQRLQRARVVGLRFQDYETFTNLSCLQVDRSLSCLRPGATITLLPKASHAL